MNDKRSFGEYIRKKRLEQGLTQKELARQLFVTESTISKWERALSYPDISMVPDICRALRISEHEFFTACDDERERTQAREAKLWRDVTKGLRLLCAAGYAIALLVCFICDLAVSHTLDWFWIVPPALMLAFSFTNLPALLHRRRLPVCLGAASGSLLLLLFACWLYAGGRWVLGGAAIAAVCLALPWGWWAIRRFYAKHTAPLCMALFSVWVFILLAVIRAFAGGDWLLGFAYPIAAFCVGYCWLCFAVICWLPTGPWLKAAAVSLLSALAVPLGNALSAAIAPAQNAPALMDYFSIFALFARRSVNGLSWINVLVFYIMLLLSAVLLAIGFTAEVRRRAQE